MGQGQRDKHEKGTWYNSGADYFLGCIEKNQKPKVSTPAESRLAVALALAEVKSAQTGKPVAIK